MSKVVISTGVVKNNQGSRKLTALRAIKKQLELWPWGNSKVRNWRPGAEGRGSRKYKTRCSKQISLKKPLKDSSTVSFRIWNKNKIKRNTAAIKLENQILKSPFSYALLWILTFLKFTEWLTVYINNKSWKIMGIYFRFAYCVNLLNNR